MAIAAVALASACGSSGEAKSKNPATDQPNNVATNSTPEPVATPAPEAQTKRVDPAPPDMRVDGADPQDFSTPTRPTAAKTDIRSMMDVANKHYDRQDYEAARAAAHAVIAVSPDNLRMLRLIVSSACMLGDADEARTYHARLPARDAKQIARRCANFNVKL
jgi:hypothetical protein